MHPHHHARQFPDKVAYVMADSGEQVSYAQLEARSNQFAHLLRALGLKAGDHMAVLMENHARFFEVCFGAQRAGIIFTAISTRLKASETAYIIGNCGAWAPHDNPRLAHIIGVGITVTPAWQGRGVGSALLSAMVQQVRDYQPYRRMELTAFAGNTPAIALYRKLGFQQEAVLTGYAYQAGQYRDCLQMSLWLK